MHTQGLDLQRIVFAGMPEEEAEKTAPAMRAARFAAGQLHAVELLGIGIFQFSQHLGRIDIDLLGQQVLALHQVADLLRRPG